MLHYKERFIIMRKTAVLLLLSITFLFQSCFSYQEIDKNSNSKKIGEKYKIQVSCKSYKRNLIAFNDSIVHIKNGNAKNEFKISEINKLQKRTFSILKTLGYSTGIVVAIVALFSLTYSPSISVGNSPN
jgi:hypothetical protein